ncbi:stromelysin-3-like [Saccoglossus kowalevskii]
MSSSPRTYILTLCWLQLFVAFFVICFTHNVSSAPQSLYDRWTASVPSNNVSRTLSPTPQPLRDVTGAMEFLYHYGYMDIHHNAIVTEDTFTDAVSRFQAFVGLEITGKADEATLAMMNAPRCDVADIDSSDGRKKRYMAVAKWQKNKLTYKITKYTGSPFLSQSDVDREIEKAFKLWSDVTPLRFEQVPAYMAADIDISFPEPYIPHADGFRYSIFDGPGKTLAHAFYPYTYGDVKGDAHFDDGEQWTANSYTGINLWLVAAHEFGHSLGLGHTNVNGALMFPYHQGYNPNFQLHDDDVAGIQFLYGAQIPEATTLEPIVKPNPNPNPNPNPECPTTVDAITQTKDGNTYAFQGNYFWQIEEHRVVSGYPKRTSDYWSGLVGDFDAIFTASSWWVWNSNGRQQLAGKTWFFKGNLVWRFENMIMDNGYPKYISQEFTNLPSNIDAAFEYYGNGQTYFFKGGFFYMINWRMEVVGPFYMDNWQGIPSDINSAFQDNDQYVYFFKDNLYYKFEHDTFSTLAGYPRSTSADWFQCNALNEADQSDDIKQVDDIIDVIQSDGYVTFPCLFTIILTILVQYIK